MPLRLSIAMTTYNGARFVGEQLTSFAAQTRRPDELVVCDDASKDDTVARVADFAATAPFAVQIHQNVTNLGPGQNFAKAISLCTGDVIFLSDQDDVWNPQKIELEAAIFEKDPRVGLVSADAEVVDEELKPLGYTQWQNGGFAPRFRRRVRPGRGFRTLLQMPQADAATLAFRTPLREIALPIPTGWWGFDQWIALCAAAGADWQIIDRPLQRYRQHRTQAVGSKLRTLRDWANDAPITEAQSYHNLARNFDELADRLTQHRDRLQSPGFIALAQGKAAFHRARAAMRERRGRRFGVILSQLLRGHYRRYSRGWLTVARDLKG